MLHLTGLAIIQGYIVQHFFFPEYHFRTTVFTSLCLNVFLYAFYRLLIYPYFLSPLRHLPTIPGRPHVKIIFDNPRGRIPLEWIRSVPNEGLIHFRNVFSQSMLLVTSHQALLDVMSSRTYDFEKPWRARDFLARIIGFGLILSEGQAHRKQRRALTPAFSIKNIRALYGLMWEKTGLLLDEMESELRRNPFEEVSTMGKIELSIWASRLTLDIIGPAAMGRDFQSLHNPENKVADSFTAILEPTREKMAFLAINFMLPQWFARRLPWSLNKVVDNETGFLRDLCNEIVQEKRAAIVASGATAKELEADILGTMMMGGDFTDDELVDQMLTFLAAGHETTASALTWGCYLLTLHPQYQDRLRAEIRDRIPSGNAPITWSNLESMPLLNGVCQEVLRLYPTVPVTIRESVRDTIVANKPVPKGTRLILCPYAINRSPEFWGPTGEDFLPERWIDTDPVTGKQTPNQHGGAGTNFAQITFLHGQRSCIGKDFARAELRCAMAGVVGRFRFRMQDPKQEIHIAF